MIRFFVQCVFLMLTAFCSNAGSLNFNAIAGAGNYQVPVTSFFRTTIQDRLQAAVRF